LLTVSIIIISISLLSLEIIPKDSVAYEKLMIASWITVLVAVLLLFLMPEFFGARSLLRYFLMEGLG